MPGLKKVHYIIIGIALLAVCTAVILVAGRTATAEIPLYGDTATELSDLTITMDPAEGVAELTDVSLEDGILSVTVRGIAPGNVLVQAVGPDGTGVSAIFYVHRSGFVTTGTFFGNSRGISSYPSPQRCICCCSLPVRSVATGHRSARACISIGMCCTSAR